MRKKNRGFRYYLTDEQIHEYQKMPLYKRLLWLYQGNIFRKYYPKSIIALQESFRK